MAFIPITKDNIHHIRPGMKVRCAIATGVFVSKYEIRWLDGNKNYDGSVTGGFDDLWYYEHNYEFVLSKPTVIITED